jgi:hypothetical protein
MSRKLRESGLSLVLFVLFFVTLAVGQTLTGLHEANAEAARHGKPTKSMGEYLIGSHFWEATMKNWEFEFLQMGVYVILTVFLFQKGSAETKSLSEPEPVDRDPRTRKDKKDAPWPVRKGGFVHAAVVDTAKQGHESDGRGSPKALRNQGWHGMRYEILARVGRGQAFVVENEDGHGQQYSDVSDTLNILRDLGWRANAEQSDGWSEEAANEDRALAHVLGMCRRLESNFSMKEIVARIRRRKARVVLEFAAAWGRLIRAKIIRRCKRGLPDTYEVVEPKWAS